MFSQKLKEKAFLWAFLQIDITYDNKIAALLTLNVQKPQNDSTASCPQANDTGILQFLPNTDILVYLP